MSVCQVLSLEIMSAKKNDLAAFLGKEITRRQKILEDIKHNREWFSLRSMLSYSWAMYLFFIGGRSAGKSYAICHFLVHQWKEYGRPFYWLRLSEASAQKLLIGDAQKLVDADIRRYYNLDLEVVGDSVFEVTKRGPKKPDGSPGKIIEKKLMARVLGCNTFYNDKGSALYDKDFLKDPRMYYNIILDEMNRESTEKNSFSIVDAVSGQIENLVRTEKKRVRIMCVGNLLSEASDLLVKFNFLPEQYGIYKIKKKKAVICYMEPTDKEIERRKGSAADILNGDNSNFTNEIKTDTALITKKRLQKPSYIIAFTNETKFTVWDGNVVCQYNKELCSHTVAMRPYLDYLFEVKARDNVMQMFDTRSYRFRNLVTQKIFKKELALLKPRK